MTVINKTQPMREAEIDIVDYINGGLAEKLNELDETDAQLRVDLTTETNNRIDGDTELTNKLTDETNDRIAADNTLDTKIDAEINQRENDVKTLTDNITAETARAVKAESDLGSKLNAEIARATSEENSITNHLETAEAEFEAKFLSLMVQPTSFEFTDVIDGVTIQVANFMRYASFILYTLHITVADGTSVSPDTAIATVPSCVGGGSVGIGSLIAAANVDKTLVSFTATSTQLTNNIIINGPYDGLVTFVNQYVD